VTGEDLPRLLTELPGPRSRAAVDRLARRECPAITARRARRAAALGAADADPVVWEEALGCNVQDLDGNVLVDMTAGFGVAAAGHRNPAVVAAVERQAGRLLHAMGDAWPDIERIELLDQLCAGAGMDRAILGSSGSDAVEAALKTARVATGRDGVLAFEGAYHGLSYGALAATAYKADWFRAPFAGQLGAHVRHLPFGGPIPPAGAPVWEGVGAVLVEPLQGRGGVRVPPPGWLAELAARAAERGALLVLDEVYTGFGRTGTWLAAWHEGVRPDLVCVGKALGGGLPISACLGTAAAMDAWGASTGEALHTQTFLGHPLACAAARASLDALEAALPGVAPAGRWFAAALEAAGFAVQGRGLMLGVAAPGGPAPPVLARRLLSRGWLALPAGEEGEVLALSPPLTTPRAVLAAFVEALADCARERP
jgi:4-aminobutyrate aminotransferase / (S)-3-amino-2-methylpropionate transaminase / 5-aminovalerate transaminase